jgi:hypothetical protein
MNFGEYYINCVKTLYKDIGTHVTNNGYLSEQFSPTRGIRQGCPLSANLFVIIVEILACTIRQNQRISGIKIGETEIKISQYADDTCIFVQDSDSLRVVFHVLDIFTKCSGLKVNKEKSEAIGIGATTNYKHKDIGIKWPNGSIKCLGIFINVNPDRMIEDNFKPCLEKIEHLLSLWCLRKLTLKGRILVINTLVISQLIYLCTVLHTPKWVLDKYDELIKPFIWNSKPAKVKYKCLINNIEDGGLKLQDLPSKIKAIKLKWFKDLVCEELNTPWKAYVNTYFKEKVSRFMSYNCSAKNMPPFHDKFYSELFKLWADMHHKEPSTAEEICRQPICQNDFIKIGLKPLRCEDIGQYNIKFVQDLLNADGTLMNINQLNDKHNIKFPFMLYNGLVSAIPSKWKKMLKTDSNCLNYYVFYDHKITAEEGEKKVTELTTKELYWILVKKSTQRPTSENSWESEVGLGFGDDEWSFIYTNPYNLTRDTKVLAFQYKVTHRFLACKHKLHTWKIEKNNICNSCNKEDDILEHHLVACPQTLDFWTSVFKWFKAAMGISFPIDTYDIIFGIPNPNSDTMILQLNFILLYGMYHTYRRKQAKKEPELYVFLLECKQSLEIKKYMMVSNGKKAEFEKHWELLHNNI